MPAATPTPPDDTISAATPCPSPETTNSLPPFPFFCLYLLIFSLLSFAQETECPEPCSLLVPLELIWPKKSFALVGVLEPALVSERQARRWLKLLNV